MKMETRVIEKRNERANLKPMQKAGLFFSRHWALIVICLLGVLCFGMLAFADDAQAVSVWNKLFEQLEKWIQRLGWVVIVVGGIMFGLSFQSENPEQRTRGIYVMVAGAIVTALAYSIIPMLLL